MHAGPRPVRRPLGQPRAHRVERHIAQRGAEVRLVHGHTAEAALPEVAGALLPGVDAAGIAAMHRRQHAPQGVFLARDQDQVHMVGHQHPGPHLHARGGSVLGHQVAIGAIVVVAEEGLGPTVATLGDVVGDAGEHRAGETGHGASLGSGGRLQFSALSP